MSEYTKYRLVLSYDGTAYCGWQQQAGDPSVQQELERSVKTLFQEDASVHGASRTDSGVHALHQVAHFRVRKHREPEQVVSALNHHLPVDVTVHSASVADPDFQAHMDATGKTYLYVLLNRREPPSLFRSYLHWYAAPLAIKSMREGLHRMEGRHPFSGFATDAAKVEDPVCELTDVRLVTRGSCLFFGFTGDRFLYNLVRALVGTLIEIGKGNRTPSVVDRVIEERDRDIAGPVVPAGGLYLAEVYYEDLGSVSVRLEERIRHLFPEGAPFEVH